MWEKLGQLPLVSDLMMGLLSDHLSFAGGLEQTLCCWDEFIQCLDEEAVAAIDDGSIEFWAGNANNGFSGTFHPLDHRFASVSEAREQREQAEMALPHHASVLVVIQQGQLDELVLIHNCSQLVGKAWIADHDELDVGIGLDPLDERLLEVAMFQVPVLIPEQHPKRSRGLMAFSIEGWNPRNSVIEGEGDWIEGPECSAKGWRGTVQGMAQR